jgi:hypothetical protein
MYTELENQLIQAAKEWSESQNFEVTINYDNTPFLELSNGLKVRATKEQNGWEFKAIARWGYSGINCKRLQESIDWALKEKNEHEAKIREQIKLRLLE